MNTQYGTYSKGALSYVESLAELEALTSEESEASRWVSDAPVWLVAPMGVLAIVFLGYVALFADWWPWNHINLVGAFAAQAVLMRSTREAPRLMFRHVVAPIAIVAGTAVVSAAFNPSLLTLTTGEWQFLPSDGAPPSGVYVELAGSDGIVWLFACEDGQLFGVPTESVVSVRTVPVEQLNPAYSLLDLLFHGAPGHPSVTSTWCPS